MSANVKTAMALVGQGLCAGWPEPLLVTYVISTPFFMCRLKYAFILEKSKASTMQDTDI